jgi:hypothetical protein
VTTEVSNPVSAIPCHDLDRAKAIHACVHSTIVLSSLDTFLSHFDERYSDAEPIILSGTIRKVTFFLDMLREFCLDDLEHDELLSHFKYVNKKGALVALQPTQIYNARYADTMPIGALTRLRLEFKSADKSKYTPSHKTISNPSLPFLGPTSSL